jgi:hypothetical protein
MTSLEYKEKKINKRVPLVLTYHPSLEKISGIVRHHWKEMNGHRSDLTKKTLLPVSPGHSLDDFVRSKIYIIDHNPSWKENQRHKRESFWIRELQTLHPEGINKKV